MNAPVKTTYVMDLTTLRIALILKVRGHVPVNKGTT